MSNEEQKPALQQRWCFAFGREFGKPLLDMHFCPTDAKHIVVRCNFEL